MILSRDQILGATDRPFEDVEIPEWGGTVRVSTMSGTARDAFEQSVLDEDRKPDLTNMRAKLVARCLIDEAGQTIFSEADVAALGAKSATALERVVKVAERLNRLGSKQLEEIRGN